jgi:hypothetical protein
VSKYKLTLRAKAQIIGAPVTLNEDVAQSLAKISGEDGLDQDDLLHIRSTLVTSGANRNHDVFLKDELWKARHTPLHKPSDWNHKRTQIVGHIYNVEAQTVDGRPLDMDVDEPTLMDGIKYNGDFELIVDEVVYATLLPEYAETIERLAKAGNLSVSMEAWFEDYNIIVFNKKNRDGAAFASDLDNAQILDRTTARELEPLLKSADPPGPGKTKNNDFVGRVLKNITFGGKGFVGVPANPRSDIKQVGENTMLNIPVSAHIIGDGKMKTTAVERGDGFEHRFVVSLSKFESQFFDDAQGVISGEVKADSVEMARQSFKDNILPRLRTLVENAIGELGIDLVVQGLRRKDIDSFEDENRLVYSCSYPLISRAEIERREQAQKEAEEDNNSVNYSSASTAETNQEETMNADQLKLLREQLEKANADLAATKEQMEALKLERAEGSAKAKDESRVNRVDSLFRSLAAPAEIARIDKAIKAGEDPFEAKLQWLFDTRASVDETVKELEAKLAKHTVAKRLAAVKELELYDDAGLQKLEKTLAGLSDEQFDDWMAERKMFADKIKALAEIAADEIAEDDASEKATAALDKAKPEDKPNFTETNPNEETKAGAGDNSEERIYEDLAGVISRRTSPRIERLRKQRGDYFGRYN